MKTSPKASSKIVAAGFGCCLILTIIPHVAKADRGEGSIRAAGRPAPTASRDVRAEAPHPAPESHPEAHAAAPHAQAPRPGVQVQHNWDDNDDNNARSWGGFAHGMPAPVVRGQRVRSLPASHRVVIIDNHNYEYDEDGAYYLQQSDGEYMTVQPPLSAVIPALPDGVASIVVGPTTYYYLDGVFYVAQGGSFAVVNPPAGIVVPTLPTGANQAVINGTVGYQFNGFDYLPSFQDGVTVYTVTAM